MARQSRLEKEGIGYRHEALVKNDYQRDIDEYSESHEDAQMHDDDRHPLGKGTNSGGPTYLLPDENASKTRIKPTIDTANGGGSYDIYGRNGIGGRNKAMTINIYNSNNQYGVDSVDTTNNVLDGQYVIK